VFNLKTRSVKRLAVREKAFKYGGLKYLRSKDSLTNDVRSKVSLYFQFWGAENCTCEL